MTRLMILAFAAGPLLVPVSAQDAKPGSKKAEPKTWMCKKGTLLWEEKLEGGAWSKEWNKYKGDFVVEGGALKSAEQKEDNHHPAMSRPISESNVIIQCSIKFEGNPWMGLSLDDKEHVARLMFSPADFKLLKMSGIGETTKGADMDVTRFKLDDKAWHIVVWEIFGDEMVASIDEVQAMALGRADLTAKRSRLELINGGQWAWWKNLKVWKADGRIDKWPEKRAQLYQLLKKKPPADK